MQRLRFAIDRGGTFTDVFAEPCDDRDASTDDTHNLTPPKPPPMRVKLLSVDPTHYDDAPTEGIRRLLERFTKRPHPREEKVDTSAIASIRMGTTVATNALLERDGARTLLLITRGFRDVLHIGNQSRPRIFDLSVACPGVLYERVVEIDERVRLVADSEAAPGGHVVQGSTGARLVVERSPDVPAVEAQLRELRAEGFEAVAIVLMHAYTFAEHEVLLADAARRAGFSQVSTSSGSSPMVKLVSRGYTATADAYLTPHIRAYLASFTAGFDEGIARVPISFMQSDGGLASASHFSGYRAILSGPAGGYIGYARTAHKAGGPPVVGFDMGGTSTDVSRYAGDVEQIFETTLAGVTIQAPQLAITTVAAGGGSRFFFREGLFQVGPESARADPGPVCYRKKGYLATTDGNLLLGRLRAKHFPHIFGPAEDEPLDLEGTRSAFDALARDEINPFFCAEAARLGVAPREMSAEEVAYGFIKVANEAMCRPIREITQMRGHDITTHTLAVFGGAGGQHACAIARALGMSRIVVHRYASILSAYGISLADVVIERQEATALVYGAEGAAAHIAARHAALSAQAAAELAAEGFAESAVRLEHFLNLRYQGTDTAIMIKRPPSEPLGAFDYAGALRELYEREFGFRLDGRAVLVDDIRVRGIGVSNEDGPTAASTAEARPDAGTAPTPIDADGLTYFESGWHRTPMFRLCDLAAGDALDGPCILLDDITTVLVEPHCRATVSAQGDIAIQLLPLPTDSAEPPSLANATQQPTVSVVDPIRLSVFSHRFMGIAEQMGRTLQRTSVSTNIKERLDFSCAIFDSEGGLVANAPHIPVHLGAMQDAVRVQLRRWHGNMSEGDVFVSNHPQLAGGSHLPDITVITPVFSNCGGCSGGGNGGGASGEVVFWVASRGHHADIGGSTPGSMPPFSTSLNEEGAQIIGVKLVERGVFQEESMREVLAKSRNLADNLSDLRAQVAANQMGIRLLQELIDESSLTTVREYMLHIQRNAEACVRSMLRSFATARLGGSGVAESLDLLDDGSEIHLAVSIDADEGSAVFDFTGTHPEVYGNLNAPPAVTYSAIIYCLRCMCGAEIPLNQGCLAPVTVRLPEGCLLNPSATAAVVGGNVLTSQRVVDVILRAFGTCAASQGCMNNLTFGDERFGYYETIAGGAGAGPTWEGRSGVHTHMTNTRITDPEILEQRYPVVLRAFSLRPGSGGAGRMCGGDGVVREIEFLKPVRVSILSERRALRPYGLEGGAPGAAGKNLLIRADGSVTSLGGKASVSVDAGARVRLLTPGGGGFGPPPREDRKKNS